MKLVVLAFVFLLGQNISFAQETFSIVAVDSATREVGSAGASCVKGAAQIGGVIIISDIIPGRGGVNAQAYICVNPHSNLVAAINRMKDGLSPVEIIDWLKANDGCSQPAMDPEWRQYGIADLDTGGRPRSAAFTGSKADSWKGHKIGKGYAIQGNILLGPQVLDSIEVRFLRAKGSLADRLMFAIQGANFPGADARCLSQGTSSTSAFLQVYKPTDSEGKPFLRLNVAETASGVEPIDSLHQLFNSYKATTGLQRKETLYQVYPNPAKNRLVVNSGSININEGFTRCTISNLNGNVLLDKELHPLSDFIDISELAEGAYILTLTNDDKVYRQKLIIRK